MEFEATVRDLSQQGMGVVDHPDGRVFFASGVWPGDIGVFQITEEKKRYGFAKLVELKTPSQDRVTPPCPHQGTANDKCGGCPWMIASTHAQLDFKTRITQEVFNRSKIKVEVQPTIGSPHTLHYRNRAQLKTNGSLLGFVGEKSKALVDIDSCLVLNPKCNALLKELRSKLPKKEWEPKGRYLWNLIDIDDTKSIETLSLNQRLPFRQGNTSQNETMKAWLLKEVSTGSFSSALELFSGDGNFTESLVKADIPGILSLEVSAEAIDGLSQKALSGVETKRSDLTQENPRKLLKYNHDFELLVLDPPREGFERLNEWVNALPKLKKIIYISCSIQSLTRDLKPLIDSDWALSLVQPIDLFPHTPHVEVMTVLEK